MWHMQLVLHADLDQLPVRAGQATDEGRGPSEATRRKVMTHSLGQGVPRGFGLDCCGGGGVCEAEVGGQRQLVNLGDG